VVLNKIDLVGKSSLEKESLDDIKSCSVSCVTGEGIPYLESMLIESIRSLLSSKQGDEGDVLITRERHRRHLKECIEHLEMFLLRSLPMDAAAEELR
jgi:tRNA modification GTPase